MSQANVRYARNPDYVFRKIVDEMVLVPIRQNVADMDCIYTMNPLGAFIWEKLDGGASGGELLAAIVDRYDVGQQEAEEDLAEYLAQLEEAGAIQRL